jgi:hypothetical protein
MSSLISPKLFENLWKNQIDWIFGVEKEINFSHGLIILQLGLMRSI